jgi:hypothetical protein
MGAKTTMLPIEAHLSGKEQYQNGDQCNACDVM